MISITNAKLRLGGEIIFEDLSWRIDLGDRVGLVGPNGSGKTSILRVLVGENSLEAGTIEKSKNLRVGYLPQDAAELPDQTVSQVFMSAFDDLNVMEDQMHRHMETIQSTPTHSPAHNKALHQYSVLEETFRHRGGYSREADAKKVLSGLGFHHSEWERPVREFSGGWRMRVLLGRLLLEKPDILLLDEPTNHLDPDTLSWFEQYLLASESGLVLVSHDRYFLDRMVKGIAEIDQRKFRTYKGNYTTYKKKREEIREQLIAQKRNQDREIAHLEKFVERFKAKNTKASQAQSRIKRLEKIDRIEIETDSSTIAIPMPQVPRSGKEVLILDEVSHWYDDLQALQPVSTAIYRGDKIAVWGANGAGKSTLLSIMAQDKTPTYGTVKWGHNIHVAYFSQHHAELQSSQLTLLEELESVAPPEMRTRLRDVLGAFLFRGDDVFKSVSVCSGGEKSRLALAKLLIRPINVMIMDEPLNHLDISTVEILEDALHRFEGTIIFVSHDRFFVDRLATQVWEMKAGQLRVYKGNYSDYQYAKQFIQTQNESLDQTDNTNSETDTNNVTRQQRKEKKRREAEERNRSGAKRREQERKCEVIEHKIHELEAQIDELEGRLSSGELVQSPNEMTKVSKRYKSLLKTKERLYRQWEKMVESIEVA